VYVDGHERDDVVTTLYLRKLEVLEATHAPPPCCSDDPIRVCQEEDEGKKRLILMYHYESIFLDGQGWLWVEVESNQYNQRGKGEESWSAISSMNTM
jgi:hypothetical protein